MIRLALALARLSSLPKRNPDAAALMLRLDECYLMSPALIVAEPRPALGNTSVVKGTIRVAGRDIACAITRITDVGADIQFGRPTIVPDSFRLVLPDHWFEADCDVRHRGSDSISVSFSSNRREALARFG